MEGKVLKEIFELLVSYGVRHVVVSPGSRNASLIQGAEAIETLKKYVVVDERCAGFTALGLAMVSRTPVALVCTSGTAVLNYAPAVAEAFYQGVPLIVLSADRPMEWIDQDDSQTIRQPGSLANIVKGYYNINGDAKEPDQLWYINRMLNEGLSLALAPKQGPVHFNVPHNGILRSEEVDKAVNARKINRIIPPRRLENQQIKELADFARDMKIMITAGFMLPDNKLQKAIATLYALPNVCVMAETLSNLHLPEDAFMVDTALFRMDSEAAETLRPDLVISIGGALVSRKLKEFVRNYPPRATWNVGYAHNIADCFKSLTAVIECDPATFLQSFGKRLKYIMSGSAASGNADYRQSWIEFRRRCYRPVTGYPWCDLSALTLVLNTLPEETNLFLSNGTSVRYGQIIPYPLSHAVYSNRGVSGIEGSTSTAIGASLAYDKLTCLITGDMSFAYDIGALASRLVSPKMRIVVLGNGGGDIFRFIPATSHLAIREKYLCAECDLPISDLAAAYGWDYFYAASESDLQRDLEEFFHVDFMPKILHIDTSAEKNSSEILRNYLSGK